MKKALLIDGNSIVYRAYYGSIKLAEFAKANNLPVVNAIKVTLLMIIKLLNETDYAYAVMAFDHKDGNFRKAQNASYKANRKKQPDDLFNQINILQKILPAFGIKVFCISGIEADDIIASCSSLLNKHNISCEIYSSDKDLLQLVNKYNTVNLVKKGIGESVAYTPSNFAELTNGLNPLQICDLKGLYGDNSDNLKGVSGIGEKTALKLLIEHGSLENIYNNLNLIKQQSLKQKLIDDKESAFLCKQLATLVTNYFDDETIALFAKDEVNINEIQAFLDQYKFTNVHLDKLK